jgi:hypothetical protein
MSALSRENISLFAPTMGVDIDRFCGRIVHVDGRKVRLK